MSTLLIEMQPLHNFKDHPQLTRREPKSIYLLDNGFYLVTTDDLRKIWLNSIEYTNMGEPFRQFARVCFSIQPELKLDSIDIDMHDAARLLQYCQNTCYSLVVTPELASNKRFVAAVEALTDDDD